MLTAALQWQPSHVTVNAVIQSGQKRLDASLDYSLGAPVVVPLSYAECDPVAESHRRPLPEQPLLQRYLFLIGRLDLDDTLWRGLVVG